MSNARRALTHAVAGCFFVLIALNAPAPNAPLMALDEPASDLKISASEVCLDAGGLLPAIAEAAAPTCTPPPGCSTPAQYCSCIANGYPAWVCAWYGC